MILGLMLRPRFISYENGKSAVSVKNAELAGLARLLCRAKLNQRSPEEVAFSTFLPTQEVPVCLHVGSSAGLFWMPVVNDTDTARGDRPNS